MLGRECSFYTRVHKLLFRHDVLYTNIEADIPVSDLTYVPFG